MSTFKDRLEEAVERKGLTIAEARRDLRRLTGMTRSNMTHWFGGRTIVPSARAALIAAEYLGVDPRWLAEGRGQIGPKFTALKTKEVAPPLDEAARFLLEIAAEMDSETLEVWRKIGFALLSLARSKERNVKPMNPKAKIKLVARRR